MNKAIEKNGGEFSGSGWKAESVKAGVRDVYCESWAAFSDFTTTRLERFNQYIFRGQASEHWDLLPTLDRKVHSSSSIKLEEIHSTHLDNFKYAARGRRGQNPMPTLTDEEWWALGQHFGLSTPLLDWTEAPFVAAFFAFSLEDDVDSENVVIYGLHRGHLEKKSSDLAKSASHKGSYLHSPVKLVTPLVEDNARLINQRGLFTWAPAGICVERWIRGNYPQKEDGAAMLRIFVPRKYSRVALRTLNRMNVNHLSLFPDLSGASKYCNYNLVIARY